MKANKYDLSSSRYRQIEQEEVFYEKPEITMQRLLELEKFMASEVAEIRTLAR